MKRGVALVVGILALVMLQARLLFRFGNEIDLHPADELAYLVQGQALAQGSFADGWLAWSPILSACYGVLGLLGVPVVARPDVMCWVVSVAGSLALWWCLRPLVGAGWALLPASLWATMPLPLHAEFPGASPTTYLFSATLAWLGAGCIARRRNLLGTLLLAAAAFDRGELAPALLLAGVTLVFWKRHRPGGLSVLVAGAAAIAHHQIYPASQARAWMAFEQHYAQGANLRGDGSADFFRPGPAMARDFPGAHSPAQALLANPGAVARHALANAGDLPHAFAVLLASPMQHAPGWRVGSLVALVLLVVWTLARARKRWRRLARSRAPAMLALAAAGFATLPTNLLLRPRADLSLAWVPVIAVIVALTARSALPRNRWLIGWIAAVALAATALWAPPRFGVGAAPHRETRAAARILERADLAAGDTLAGLHAERLRWFHEGGAEVSALDFVDLYADADSVEVVAARFRAAAPRWVLASPTLLTELGPVSTFLQVELLGDDWEVADVVFPLLLYRRTP